MSQKKLILGGFIIAIFLGFGMLSFKKTLTPYVSFAEAREASSPVQVKGYPDHQGARFDPEVKAFCFSMKNEDGEMMKVVYRGPKPGNFDQAESVVAIGRYEGGVLESNQILVKCPSKYESEYEGEAGYPDGPKRKSVALDDTPIEPAADEDK